MQKAEIDALVRAHRGRTQPVAFLHVLRQPMLGPDDHAFLSEHIHELGASDLLRWRARCEKGFTAPIIRQLGRRAIDDPATFRHEVLSVPRLELDPDEWTELSDLLRGKVPREIFDLVLARGFRPPRPHVEPWFSPGVIPAPLFGPADEELLPENFADPEALANLPVRTLVIGWKRGTLALDRDELLVLLRERARQSGDDWSLAVLEFPGELTEAVLEKARHTARSDERANLLGWLEAEDVPRSTLLPLALAPTGVGGPSFAIVAWLARQLTSRAAWDKHGRAALSALMGQGAIAQIGDLMTVAFCEASRNQAPPPRGLLEAMQVAFALTLIDTARDAISRCDPISAMGALSALACLDPPSRISGPLHALRAAEGASREVIDLIAVNERLVKHSDARDASFEGVIAAVHAVADTIAAAH